MGKYFQNKDEFVDIFSTFYDILKFDKKVGTRLAASRIIVRFEYSDPDAWCTIDASRKPQEPGAYAAFVWDSPEPEPEVIFHVTADFAHRFWHGKENALLSAATGKIRASGNTAKALAILPAFKPAYRLYPRVLKQIGRADLVV